MVDGAHKLGQTNILLTCFLSYSARENRRSAMTDTLNITAKHDISTWFPVETCYFRSINKIYNAGISASIVHHVIREFGIVFSSVLCLCYFFIQQNNRGSGIMWRKHLFMICTSYDLNTKNEQYNDGAAHRMQISFLALPFRHWFDRKNPTTWDGLTGVFIVLEYACCLSFKQKANHRNVVRALGREYTYTSLH